MAINFQESKTKENLMKAFAGESQARNRYTIAAGIAKKQGLHAIGEIFIFTAEQERAHAKRFYELLKPAEGMNIDICGGFPVDTYDSVMDLLRSAEHNEMEEFEDVYPAFGNVAKEEGFLEIASAFFQIAEVEHVHARRFEQLKSWLENQKYFERSEKSAWMCLNCGYIHEGLMAPDVCPVCRHEKGYFIPLEMAPYTI